MRWWILRTIRWAGMWKKGKFTVAIPALRCDPGAPGRVVKYCGCDVAASLLARAKAVLNKLEELINAFARAMANHQLLAALLLLLAIIPLLIELAGIVAAMGLAAA